MVGTVLGAAWGKALIAFVFQQTVSQGHVLSVKVERVAEAGGVGEHGSASSVVLGSIEPQGARPTAMHALLQPCVGPGPLELVP